MSKAPHKETAFWTPSGGYQKFASERKAGFVLGMIFGFGFGVALGNVLLGIGAGFFFGVLFGEGMRTEAKEITEREEEKKNASSSYDQVS